MMTFFILWIAFLPVFAVAGIRRCVTGRIREESRGREAALAIACGIPMLTYAVCHTALAVILGDAVAGPFVRFLFPAFYVLPFFFWFRAAGAVVRDADGLLPDFRWHDYAFFAACLLTSLAFSVVALLAAAGVIAPFGFEDAISPE